MKRAHEAQVELSTAAAEVAGQLRNEWHLLEDIAKKEKQKLTEEESRVQKKAAFLAAQLVVFLHHVLSHLQNMIAFVTVGLLLMLLAINYYPFQPREWLLWFNCLFSCGGFRADRKKQVSQPFVRHHAWSGDVESRIYFADSPLCPCSCPGSVGRSVSRDPQANSIFGRDF
jgi:hypothetical protein